MTKKKKAPADMHCPMCQRLISAAEFESVEDEGDGFTWFCICGVCECEVGQ